MADLALATQLVALAKERSILISAAESCTGGLLSGAITAVAGSSEVFDRGFVTYSNAAKIDMLGVSPDTLAQHGAVSEAVAAEMAQGALRNSLAGLAVSVTGVAGPGPSEHKPEGRVCFGVVMSGLSVRSETVEFSALGRAQVREKSVAYGLNLLLGALLQ